MKKHITIYQLPKEKYADFLKNRFNTDYKINTKDYIKVYEYDKNITKGIEYEVNYIADLVFEDCNIGEAINNKNYNSRSLSCGDIIKIDDMYLLCESFGWTRINFK